MSLWTETLELMYHKQFPPAEIVCARQCKAEKMQPFLQFLFVWFKEVNCFSSECQLQIFHTFSHVLKEAAFTILRLY